MSTIAERMRAAAALFEALGNCSEIPIVAAYRERAKQLRADADELERVGREMREGCPHYDHNQEFPMRIVATNWADRIRGEQK